MREFDDLSDNKNLNYPRNTSYHSSNSDIKNRQIEDLLQNFDKKVLEQYIASYKTDTLQGTYKKAPRFTLNYKDPWEKDKMTRNSGLLDKLTFDDKLKPKTATQRLDRINFLKEIKRQNKPEESKVISISATAYQGRLIYPDENTEKDMLKYQNFFGNHPSNKVKGPDDSFLEQNPENIIKKDKIDFKNILKNPLNFTEKQKERARLPSATTKNTKGVQKRS